jgi:hypothetical protein
VTAGLVRAAQAAAEPEAVPYSNQPEALRAIVCADTDNPRNPLLWPRLGARADERSPYFGRYWATISQPCATWPARDRDRYTGPFDVPHSGPGPGGGHRASTRRRRYAQRRGAGRPAARGGPGDARGLRPHRVRAGRVRHSTVGKYLVTASCPPRAPPAPPTGCPSTPCPATRRRRTRPRPGRPRCSPSPWDEAVGEPSRRMGVRVAPTRCSGTRPDRLVRPGIRGGADPGARCRAPAPTRGARGDEGCPRAPVVLDQQRTQGGRRIGWDRLRGPLPAWRAGCGPPARPGRTDARGRRVAEESPMEPPADPWHRRCGPTRRTGGNHHVGRR